MINLRNVIQAQYEETRNVIHTGQSVSLPGCPSGSTQATSPNCLTLGRTIHFQNNSSRFDVRNAFIRGGLIGTSSDANALRNSDLREDYNGRVEHQITWGAEFYKMFVIDGSSVPIEPFTSLTGTSVGLAVFRAPFSGGVMIIPFGGNSFYVPNGDIRFPDNNRYVNIPTVILIRNSQAGFRSAAICINSGGNSANITTAIPADDYVWSGNDFKASISASDLKGVCGW